ncbi:MAG TPA: GNAT family N-acetyltransferase [Acidimicrobiales bacterium]|jgi:ribosomal protein S18 acetylase RimI-like enzyme|nr:GNAT family N-acetyltransferase [Acidimicrobiales bacterium]
MTAAIRLRPAGPEDREFLLSVYASTRTDEVAILPWDDAQKAVFLRQQAEAQDADYRRRSPDAQFLVVEYDGQDVGRLYRAEVPGVDGRPVGLRMMDVALLPEWRSRGIGTRIINDLVAEAEARGLVLSLHVEHWNPVKRLYERLGFVVAGQNEVYALMERAPARPAS